MGDKLKKSYSIKKNQKLFAENERVYDEILHEVFGTFGKHKDDSDYYRAIFTRLNGFFDHNSKIFSQLKHLSYDLSDLLKKAGKTIHKISALFSSHIKESLVIYSKIKFKSDDEVNTVYKKLKIGLNEWGSQMLTQSKYVIDNMASFFHFKKHENTTFNRLFSAKLSFGDEFRKSWDSLEKTKKKLFEGKNTEKWQIDYNSIDGDFNELFKDYEKIKPYMLPNVS